MWGRPDCGIRENKLQMSLIMWSLVFNGKKNFLNFAVHIYHTDISRTFIIECQHCFVCIHVSFVSL